MDDLQIIFYKFISIMVLTVLTFIGRSFAVESPIDFHLDSIFFVQDIYLYGCLVFLKSI